VFWVIYFSDWRRMDQTSFCDTSRQNNLQPDNQDLTFSLSIHTPFPRGRNKKISQWNLSLEGVLSLNLTKSDLLLYTKK
jgi:hypothetical protein